MADEQRATLAILGAGPVGLEAALVAARLKIDFIWLERGQAGEHLNRWGHLQTHAPLRTLVSEIGLEELHKDGPATARAARACCLHQKHREMCP